MHKPRLAKDSPAEGSRGVIERELERAEKAKKSKLTKPKSGKIESAAPGFRKNPR